MIRRVFGRDSRAGIVAGGSAAYSNGVLIGIPLMQAALGDEGTVFLIIIVAVHLPIMMLVSVFLNEWMLARGRRSATDATSRREVFRRLAISLATHPILIGVVARPALAGDGSRHPARRSPRSSSRWRAPPGRSRSSPSGMALVNYGIARQIRPAIAISGLKLVLLPVLVFVAASAIGLPPIGVAALTLTAACPTGVNAYLIAQPARHGRGARLEHGAHLHRRRGVR